MAILDVKGAIRVIFGLPFVIFIPGYLLTFALFPGKKDIDLIERMALSFGLSIAIVPLIGLILNYTPFGIRLEPIIVSLTSLVFILSAIAIWRWYRLDEKERFTISFNIELPEDKVDKVLTIALAFSIILSIALLVYIISTPHQGEKFTEFYILGPNGKAENYPTNLSTNETGNVIVGIVNHERQLINYTVEIWLLKYPICLSFDGINDYVDCGNVKLNNSFSIELWFKYNGKESAGKIYWTLLAKNLTDGGYNGLYINSTTKDFEARIGNGSRAYTLKAGENVNDDKFHHGVLVYDNVTKQCYLYYDGMLKANISLPPDWKPAVNEGNLTIGVWKAYNNYFNGIIDDVRIYKRVLNATEIQQNYEGNITTAGLVSWWKFDEGYGNVAHDSIGDNDAIIHGASWIARYDSHAEHAWFMEKIETRLNSTPVNIEDEWQPQWEYNYSFIINKTGTFKLAFLLFKNETEDFVVGKDYPEETERINEAYRECHLWITVSRQYEK